MKKFFSLILAFTVCASLLAGCGESAVNGDTAVPNLIQFEEPDSSQPVVTISVKDYGDIKIVLYPEQAPKTVENFVRLAEEDYYDGVVFHRIIVDFMIQGGDPTGTGRGGHSIWNKSFKDEFSNDLYCFNGALCMANSGPNTNGSQFFIVQNNDAEDYDYEGTIQYNEAQGRGRTYFSDNVKEKYAEVGGTPWLDGMHTVFGQVIKGMDVVNDMARTQTDENDKPLDPVRIEDVSVEYNDYQLPAEE